MIWKNIQKSNKDWYYNKRLFNGNKAEEFDDIFYFLFDDLIVNFDTNRSDVRFLFKKTEASKVEEIITLIKRFKEKVRKYKPEISLLVGRNDEISTTSLIYQGQSLA